MCQAFLSTSPAGGRLGTGISEKIGTFFVKTTKNSENTFSLLQSTLPRFFLKNYLNNYLVRYGQEENDSKKL